MRDLNKQIYFIHKQTKIKKYKLNVKIKLYYWFIF